MGEAWISMGNIIKLSTIASEDTYVYYELPIEGYFEIEQAYDS